MPPRISFFSIMAHDLRSPFNIIQGYTDLLKTNYDEFDDDERKKMINEIEQSSKNTFELLENILTWSRSQRGIIKINKEKLNMRLLIQNSIGPFQLSASRKNILITNNTEDNIEITVDKFTFSTVIGNLISNSIKYTPVGGHVLISSQLWENQIKIIIKDNGIGINKNMIEKLFRIDESYSTMGTNKEKGTGLGLIICKEFIDKNNGFISIESEETKGTSVIIDLPITNI